MLHVNMRLTGSKTVIMKKARYTSDYQVEDRISMLPDELIHEILKFVDPKFAVQTSVLSKRWKLIWTTLPSISFEFDYWSSLIVSQFFKNRNHLSKLRSLELLFHQNTRDPIKWKFVCFLEDFVEYAISNHVQHLVVHFPLPYVPYKLSNFASNSIQKLELKMRFTDTMSELHCWNLPSITTLHMTNLQPKESHSLLDQYLTCLPALRTLWLDDWDLSSSSFSLPALETLHLVKCQLPKKVWNLRALKTLVLHYPVFTAKISDMFAALVSLQNLTLSFYLIPIQVCFLPCPQLVNLEIKTCCHNRVIETFRGNIVIFAPKLSNFTSVGIFPVTFQDSKLDIVNIKLRGSIADMNLQPKELKEYFQRFTVMLPGLGSAKILNFELSSIKALSSISDFLVNWPSPFYNLKYVKVPKGCQEATISRTLRSYLLGGSPTATIVTTLP